MKNQYIVNFVVTSLIALCFIACKKDGNPNNLPPVNPADYDGKIDGYLSSDDVKKDKLVAYWSFDDTKSELKSSTAPTQTSNDAFITDAVKGKAISLNKGFLYYATQLPQFKTETFKSWSLSVWVKVKNNGSKRTMVLQLTRPGIFNGSINFLLNTNGYPATNDSVLRIAPTFTTIGGGTQDNLNNLLDKTNLNQWNHIVLTYDGTTGVFNNWLNGVKVGNYPNRGTGNNLFKCYEPNEFIIGSNYNGIPGKTVSADVSIEPMTGAIDELRMYNVTLGDAYILALYKLGLAKL